MKLGNVLLATVLATGVAFASESFNKVEPMDKFQGYKPGNGLIKKKLKAAGYYATTQEVQDILDGKKKGWKVVDVRPGSEWKGAAVANLNSKGKVVPITRIGRQTPEKALELYTPLEGVVLVCRTGTRAAFDWASYSFAGFGENVKIYGVKDWAKDCKPLSNKAKGDVSGAKLSAKKVELKEAKNGAFYWDQCKNIDWK